jgi:hypothetical protein
MMKIGIKLPSFARLSSKNRENFFLKPPAPAVYRYTHKSIRQALKSTPEGLIWRLTEDDLP